MLEEEDCLSFDPNWEELLVGEELDAGAALAACRQQSQRNCDFIQIWRDPETNDPLGFKLQSKYIMCKEYGLLLEKALI
jgi:hypothetical protein